MTSNDNTARLCFTPSASLNHALVALCRMSYDTDLSDAQLEAAARLAIVRHKPTTRGAGPVDVAGLLAWYDELTADEFLAAAGAPTRKAEAAPWS